MRSEQGLIIRNTDSIKKYIDDEHFNKEYQSFKLSFRITKGLKGTLTYLRASFGNLLGVRFVKACGI